MGRGVRLALRTIKPTNKTLPSQGLGHGRKWLLFCGYDRSPPLGHGHPQGHGAFSGGFDGSRQVPKRFTCPRLTHSDSSPAHFVEALKLCVILFCSHRRKRGDTDMGHEDDHLGQSSQVMNRQLSTLTRISIHATAAANHAEFSFPDCTGRNRRSESAVSRTFFV